MGGLQGSVSRETVVSNKAPAGARPEQSLDVLIVEGSESQMRIMESVLRSNGHRTRAATTGAEARKQIAESVPDLILLDVVLPDCSGIELIQPARAAAGPNWVPIVLMSAGDANEEILQGLSLGADDFLMKPLHPGLLNAKINSLQQIARTNAKFKEVAQMLERYRESAEVELQLARNLIQHMIKRDGLKDAALEWYVLPSAKFSGDIVASIRRDNDDLYVLFADASGHGLAAAISGLPALQVFYAMSSKGVNVGEIGREMNSKLKEYLPMGRYLAALLLRVDFAKREVEIWNGGMPSGYLIEGGGVAPSDVLQPRQLPLGVAPRDLFDPTSVTFTWQQPTRLLFFSDGLIEAVDPSGEPFGPNRLVNVATRHLGPGLIARILNALRVHMKGAAPHDDVSVLSITLP